MRHLKLALVAFFTLVTERAPAWATVEDPGIVWLGTGYGDPTLQRRAAPGQVANFHFIGLRRRSTDSVLARATSAPWPTELAGLSLLLTRAIDEIRIPLFQVYQRDICNPRPTVDAHPSCVLTIITGQVPYSLPVTEGFVQFPISYDLSLTGPDVHSRGYRLSVPRGLPHFLNRCERQGPMVDPLEGRSCEFDQIIQFGNGREASARFRPGDSLVMYAYGLGAVQGALAAGAVAKEPSSTELPYRLVGEVRLTGFYTQGRTGSFDARADVQNRIEILPTYVGLVPGQVGLYQVNFDLPPLPLPLPVCGSPSYNFTITLHASQVSFGETDGTAICVDP